MNNNLMMDLARCIEQGRAATLEAEKTADPALRNDLQRVEMLWEAAAGQVRAALSPATGNRKDFIQSKNDRDLRL
jgi:hypothetical protein